jgi:riboflavin kinase/FMN adenylyltransferase
MFTDVSGSVLVHVDEAAPIVDATPSVVVIGNFDGVHRGHQLVVNEAIEEAKRRGLAPVVLTFHPHPAGVLGRGEPPRLTTIEHRARLLAQLGVSRVVARKFDRTFAGWSPESFARDFVGKELSAKVVVVGENFRFGAARGGNLAMLEALGKQFGFEVRVHGVASDARGPFSSTRVRDALARSDIREATHVLARHHSFAGVVVHGAARGRTIGFPTANIESIVELVPPNGVYAAIIDESGSDEVDRKIATGVMNIGVRPTVEGSNARSVEAHLFNFDRDLYGVRLRVHLVAKLREEKKFDGIEMLKAQIARDAIDAKAILAANNS